MYGLRLCITGWFFLSCANLYNFRYNAQYIVTWNSTSWITMEDYIHVNYVENPLTVKDFSTWTWKYTVIRLDSRVANVTNIFQEEKVEKCTLRHILVKKNWCSQCDTQQWYHFKRKSYMKRHIMTLSNESTFQCGQCDKRFTRGSDLNSHIMTHNS